MPALIYLIQAVIYFVCVGIDIAMFFLLISLVLRWREIHWLIPFNKAGESLVTAIMVRVQVLLKARPLSEQGKLIIALFILLLLRIILGIFV